MSLAQWALIGLLASDSALASSQQEAYSIWRDLLLSQCQQQSMAAYGGKFDDRSKCLKARYEQSCTLTVNQNLQACKAKPSPAERSKCETAIGKDILPRLPAVAPNASDCPRQ